MPRVETWWPSLAPGGWLRTSATARAAALRGPTVRVVSTSRVGTRAPPTDVRSPCLSMLMRSMAPNTGTPW